MKKKSTSLAAFGIASPEALKIKNIEDVSTQASLGAGRPRLRGRGDTVGITLRLSHENWRRVHDLALTEGISINQLAMEGISEMLRKRGLKSLS